MTKKLLFLSLLFTISFGAAAQFTRSSDPLAEEDAKIVVKDKDGNVVKTLKDLDLEDSSEGSNGNSDEANTETKELSKSEKKELKKQQKTRKKELKARRKKRPKFDSFEDELLYDLNPEEFLAKNNAKNKEYLPEAYKREYLPYIYDPKNSRVYNNTSVGLNNEQKKEFRLYAFRNSADMDSNNVGIKLPVYKDKSDIDDLRFNKAELLMENGFYSAALPLLLEIKRTETNNPDINQWIGLCYLRGYNNQCRSIPYLRDAANNNNRDFKNYEAKKVADSDVDAIFLLAEAYHRCGRLQEAEGVFRAYKEAIKNNRKFEKNASNAELRLRQLAQAENLLSKGSNRFEITNLTELNGYYAEIAARPVGNNTLFFARAGEPEGFPNELNYKEGRFFTDIFKSERSGFGWSTPERISVNSLIDDVPVAVSNDGSKIFYHSYSEDSSNVYVSQKDFDTYKPGYVIFKAPPFLEYKNTFTITGDGKTMIFAAYDKEGFGGLDLFITTLNDDGSWKDPVNMGENINGANDEITPFIHPNGRTLYFSKNGSESVGGYDIFKAELNDFNQWDKPVNMGFTVNSYGDDIFYSITPDGHYGYFSRKGDRGDYDIFQINYFSTSPSLGTSNDKPSLIDKGDVLLTNLVTGKAKRYALNRVSNTYNLVLEPCVNYRLEWFYSGNKTKQETFMTPCNNETGETIEFNPFEDLGKIQVLLNKKGNGNYNNPNPKLPNAWQVLVDGQPYRFENFTVELRDNIGKVFYSTRIDRMGNFKLPDLNYQEPTFLVQVIDLDICDRLSVKNVSGKTQELRYPECFIK